MGIPSDRLSTTVIADTYIHPDGENRSAITDWEAGPIAIGNTTEGSYYQDWAMTYNSVNGEMTVTPELTGTPQVVLTVLNVVQLSFCFDQNGDVTVAYTLSDGQAYFYWYDTDQIAWVRDALAADVVGPMLTLDDKRSRESGLNDILLFYTRDTLANGIADLYHRKQRDRFQTEYLMAQDVPTYVYKLGMHDSLRVQLTMRYTP